MQAGGGGGGGAAAGGEARAPGTVTGGNNDYVEQFKILCKATSGKATVGLLEKALSHKHIYFFSDFLQLEPVQKLASSPDAECQTAFRKMEAFAFGTCASYAAAGLPPLENEAQKKKLRQLTLVSLASDRKLLSYAELAEALGVESDRELEDIVIDTIYLGLVKGRLDHRGRLFHCHGAMGRDVTPARVDAMLAQLGSWCKNADGVLAALAAARARAAEQGAAETAAEGEALATAKRLFLEEMAKSKSKDPISAGAKIAGSEHDLDHSVMMDVM